MVSNNRKKNTLLLWLPALAVCAMLLGPALPAKAVLQTITFTGVVDFGPLNGDTFDGFLEFDDAGVPPMSMGLPDLVPITDVEINFGGHTYTLADADGVNGIDYGAGFFDGQFVGLNYLALGDMTVPELQFMDGFDDVSFAQVDYVIDPLGQNPASGFGTVIYDLGDDGAGIPEPMTASLLLMTSAGLLVRRRASD